MSKLRIILEMIARGALYGGVLGALCGSSVGLGFFLVGIFLGFPFGLGVGVFVGIIVGSGMAGITVLLFYPLVEIRRYKFITTLFCVITSPPLTTVAVNKIWFGYFTLEGAPFFFALAFFAALVFAKHLSNWYIANAPLREAAIAAHP